jgi:DNA-directed RNA polymerase subunit M/transcription elongation factor TFIIS
MSDFKVIKCEKCDAGLVEMPGQKLTRCVQCGHEFGMTNKKSQRRRPRTINGNSPQVIQQIETTSVPTDASIQVQGKPDMQTLMRKLKALRNSAQGTQKQTQTKSKTAKVLPKKKKGFSIGTIIFWIVLFSVLRNIFKM